MSLRDFNRLDNITRFRYEENVPILPRLKDRRVFDKPRSYAPIPDVELRKEETLGYNGTRITRMKRIYTDLI